MSSWNRRQWKADYRNAWLLAKEFAQVFNKADNNDHRRAGEADEKEIRQQMHAEIDESAHTSILALSVV